MEFQQALQQLTTGKLSPVYCLQGSEQYLHQTFRQEIAHLLEAQLGELDLSTYDLNETPIDQVLDDAETYSFFVDQRLIIANNADFLTSQAQQKLTDGQLNRLRQYLLDPNPATVLVFICPYDSIDKRRKITKTLQKETSWIDCSPLDETAVKKFLTQEMQKSSLRIEPDAFDYFLQRVDFQLSQAMAELQKLIQFASNDQVVTSSIVKALVTRHLSSDVFELTEAILQRRIDRAVQIYQDLILLKHEPIQLHALIVSQFRLFLQVKLLQSQGLMQDQMAQILTVHPYRVKLAIQASRSMSLPQIKKLYRQLIDADYQMKSGIGNKENHFYWILTHLMQWS